MKLHKDAQVIFHNIHFHPLLACSSVFKQKGLLMK
jgi:hypothetical protein